MLKSQTKYAALLLLTAFIWGTTFVAQRAGMDSVGPMTYIACRMLLGSAVLLPVIRMRGRRSASSKTARPDRRSLWLWGAICGTVLFFASLLQQIGLKTTSVGKAGFITTLYIVIVPLLGLMFGRRISALVGVSVLLSAAGLYFLCMSGMSGISPGDVYCLFCALLFSAHILLVDKLPETVDGVSLSSAQFLVCGVWGCLGTLIFEHPTVGGIVSAAVPILYAGVLSSGVGYTLQVVSQRHVHPTLASLIMSMESVFSALAGWVVLGQALVGREILGCGLMLAAIILAQQPAGAAGKTGG
ncbi:MAG: DMT family transporter [Clostridia bacterium]|nr:DMT family transporter [Clostridia bacterium]